MTTPVPQLTFGPPVRSKAPYFTRLLTEVPHEVRDAFLLLVALASNTVGSRHLNLLIKLHQRIQKSAPNTVRVLVKALQVVHRRVMFESASEVNIGTLFNAALLDATQTVRSETLTDEWCPSDQAVRKGVDRKAIGHT